MMKIPYQPDVFARQAALLEELVSDCAANYYTPEAPLIKRDPWASAPLTALICFVTSEEIGYLVTVKGHSRAADLSYLTEKTKTHRIPIIGLYPGEETEVVLTSAGEVPLVYKIASEPLPANVPAAERMGDEAPDYNGLTFFLPADGKTPSVGYDCVGDCRWYGPAYSYKMLPTDQGRLLVGGPDLLAPPFGGTSIWEIDLLGRVYVAYRLPGGMSNDFVQTETGDLLCIGQDLVQGTVMDQVVCLDRRSSKQKKNYALNQALKDCDLTMLAHEPDWLHADGLYHHTGDDHLWVSCEALQAVLVLDLATGRGLKLLQKGKQGKVVPELGVGEKISGRLLDIFLPEISLSASHMFCHASRPAAEVLVIHEGGLGENPTGPMAHPGLFNSLKYPGTMLASKRRVYHNGHLAYTLTVSTNCYDSCYIALPQMAISYNTNPTKVLGALAEQPTFDLPLTVAEEDAPPEECNIQVWHDGEELYLDGLFFQGEMVLLTLRQGETLHQYYIQTSRKPYGAAWLKTYTDGPERSVRWAIPIAHLQGTWQVTIVIDDTSYALGSLLRPRRKENQHA